MSEDLKKMKVTIEGDTKSLKKELGSARQETRRSSAVIRKEIEKIKQSMSGKLPKVLSLMDFWKQPTGNWLEVP